MRYALIGCGRVSGNHIAAALDNGLEIVALCDVDISAAAKKKRAFALSDSVRIFSNHAQMLLECKPDLVAIATPSGSHAAIAIDCIEAGCHTIIEKPIALSLRDADAILDAQRKAGVRVAANHQNRFNTAIQQMRNALLENKFGKIFYGAASIRWHRDEAYYKSADWRGTWAQDGGTLMNQCIHAIDLLRWMLGDEITEVIGITDNQTHPYIQGEDLGLALLRCKDGRYGMIDGTVNVFSEDYEETLTLFGEKGFAKVGGTCVNRIDAWQFAEEADDEIHTRIGSGENPPNVYGFGHKSLYADMLEAICSNRAPYVDAEAGRRALETVLAIYRSSLTGQPVSLPLTDCGTAEFEGMFG